MALLLATAEAFVDGAAQKVCVHLDKRHLLASQREEVDAVHFLFPSMLTDLVQRCPQEVGTVHARNLDGILESHENAFLRPLIGVQIQEIRPFIQDLTVSDVIGFVSRKDLGQRALAGPVRPHDGVDFTGLDGQVDPLENFGVLNTRVQILDL